MPLLDTFNIQEVTGGIKIWKDEKENKPNWPWLCVVSPFARLFRVSTRSGMWQSHLLHPAIVWRP